MKIAGIFAHPADMVTECGGTLAIHARSGDEVLGIILTHGGRIHPNIYIEESRKAESERDADVAEATPQRVIEIKHAEVERAAEILGIQRLIYLDFEDIMLVVQPRIIERVADILSDYRPHVLVTQHPGFHASVGADHWIAGQIATAAATRAAQSLANLDNRDPHFIKQTFYASMGVSSRSVLVPGGGPANDVYVDITSVVEDKVRAMDQFVSQGYEGDFARKCVSGHNGHWGNYAGVAFAEPYMRASVEVYDALPVGSIRRERDEITFHRTFSRSANLWDIPREPSPTDRYVRKRE